MAAPLLSRRSILRGIGIGLITATGVTTVGGRETASVAEQLATVREATARYTDPKAAMADGFQPSGPYVPGQGWHFIHQDRLGTAAENGPTLSEPPILTYFDTGEKLVLGAAEYAVPLPNPAGYTEESPPDLFDDSGSGEGGEGGESDEGDHGHSEHGGGGMTESWHTHASAQHFYADGSGSRTDPSSITAGDLLTRGRWAEIPGESGISPGDEVTADWGFTGEETTRVVDIAPPPHPDLLTLHAWVHVENPMGPFAGMNPAGRFIERMPPTMYPDETREPQG